MKNGETFGEVERGLANETLRSLSGLAELANRARKIANVFLSRFCVLGSLGEVGGWGESRRGRRGEHCGRFVMLMVFAGLRSTLWVLDLVKGAGM